MTMHPLIPLPLSSSLDRGSSDTTGEHTFVHSQHRHPLCSSSRVPHKDPFRRASCPTEETAISSVKHHILHDIFHTIYFAFLFAIPSGIRADTAVLYQDPLITSTEAHPLAVLTALGEPLSTRAKLLQRQWDGCSNFLCTQWQMVNYVSVVLLA